MRLFALFVAVLVFAGLTAAQSLDGVWRSRGYGYVFEIQGPVLKSFEVTATTCVPGFTAKRLNRPVSGREEAFQSKDKETYFVRTGGSHDHKLLHQEESITDIRIDRIGKLPAVCEQPTTDTPLNNFEVFTRTWAENYISFDLRHTDWKEVVAQYRSLITPQTTPTQLFDIFEAMIKPLGDLHAYIGAHELKRSTKAFWRPGTDRIMKGGKDFAKHGRQGLFAITNRAYLQSPPRMFCHKHLQYGHIDSTTGYLRILSFGGYSRHNDLKALESALDTVFSDRKLQALVIDMRLSFGGSDELGLAIACRLATRDYVAFAVQARTGSKDDQWSPQLPVLIPPSSRPGFRGAVVELTGPITMSAAETFTLALMGRTPHITRIGENTQGVFCDILDRHLPNGWTFGLPNAVYRTPEGVAFDVRGIPPGIEVPVFADADVSAGKDSGMAKAIQMFQR